jgi:hypothetical protein
MKTLHLMGMREANIDAGVVHHVREDFDLMHAPDDDDSSSNQPEGRLE